MPAAPVGVVQRGAGCHTGGMHRPATASMSSEVARSMLPYSCRSTHAAAAACLLAVYVEGQQPAPVSSIPSRSTRWQEPRAVIRPTKSHTSTSDNSVTCEGAPLCYAVQPAAQLCTQRSHNNHAVFPHCAAAQPAMAVSTREKPPQAPALLHAAAL